MHTTRKSRYSSYCLRIHSMRHHGMHSMLLYELSTSYVLPGLLEYILRVIIECVLRQSLTSHILISLIEFILRHSMSDRRIHSAVLFESITLWRSA